MKRHLLLFIIVSFLAGCGSGGGGNAPAGGDNNGNTGGGKVNPQCSRTGKVAKFKVSSDGIYIVKYSDLYSDCPAVTFEPSTISLTNQGLEIPVEVVDSNGNNQFDIGDFIEFYGKAIGRDDSRFRFTETNVYWLSVGEKTGKRMERVMPTSSSGPPTLPNPSFQKRLHIENDTYYVQENYPEISLPSDVREHWFWGDRIYPENDVRTYPFSTRYIEKNIPVSIKIRVQSVSFDHYVRIYVNGNLAGSKVWDSQDPYDVEISGIPGTYFNSGPNTLTIESIGGGLFYLDWFEVIYNRQYKAESNVIEFTGRNHINLSGFSSATVPDISVYEISDPVNMKKITLVNLPRKTSSGDYEVSFSSPFTDEGLFMSLTSDQKKNPVIEPYTPSGIKSKEGDYVIITHKDFADAVKTLADYRALQGYRAAIVNMGDIYDEFGDGLETPHAVRAFLKYAFDNWSTKPLYVLLTGDATVDYKDLSGNGVKSGIKSYVPAYLYNYPGLGEVPGDNWFADVNDDVSPDMNIGRIPAKIPDDVVSVVSKIISHENSVNKSRDVLLIADDDNPSFEDLSNSIADIMTPYGYTGNKIYQGVLQENFKASVLAGMDSNPLIVNYTGHGAVYDWANNMFTSGDTVLLSNTGYPFVVALNCFNGYFSSGDEQPFTSISEALLLAKNKGAVAVFSASSWGYLSDHDSLARELYNTLSTDDVTLGEAVKMAKTRAYEKGDIMEDVVQTFIFFGDPATRLK